MSEVNSDNLFLFTQKSGTICNLLLRCQCVEKDRGKTLVLQCPSSKIAELLWLTCDRLAVAADSLYERIQIFYQNARCYDFRVETILNRKKINLRMEDSCVSTREKDILMEAKASEYSAAAVRMRDNKVLEVNEGITSISPIPMSEWAGFNIELLWDKQPLDVIYDCLERDAFIKDHVYLAYRGTFDRQQGKIIRGSAGLFVSDIYMLNSYFGEPARVCICKDSIDLPPSA